MKAERIRKPIFVVGCGRSGTSLLFSLLSQHADLKPTRGYPDGEDHQGWIENGGCVMAGLGNVNADAYDTGINGYHFCLHMNRGDVSDDIVAAMHSYYWARVLESDSHYRVINKNPHLSNKLDYLLAIFPDAKIVHIVRDPRAVVASWIAIMQEHPRLMAYWPEEELPCLWLLPRPTDLGPLARNPRFFPGGGKALFIDYWIKTNEGIEWQMVDRPQQLLTIRYEDLIASPKRMLSAVQEFCELEQLDFDSSGIDGSMSSRNRSTIDSEFEHEILAKSRILRERLGYERPYKGSPASPSLFLL